MMTNQEIKRANWARVKKARSIESYACGRKETIGIFPEVRYQVVEVIHDAVLLRDGSHIFWINISELEEPRGAQRERSVKLRMPPRSLPRRRAVPGGRWFFRQMQQLGAEIV